LPEDPRKHRAPNPLQDSGKHLAHFYGFENIIENVGLAKSSIFLPSNTKSGIKAS
jgi:hypothetical protein